MSLPAPSPNFLVLGFCRTPACSFNPQGHLILSVAFSCHLMLLAPKAAPLPGLKSSITGSLNISLFPGTISTRYLTPNLPLLLCPNFLMIMKSPSSLVPKL